MQQTIKNIVSEINDLPGTLVNKDAIIKIIVESFKNVDYPVLEYKEFVINKNSYTILVNGEKMHLPKKQLQIVYHLVQNVGRVISRDELLRYVWGRDVIVGPRTIDVHMRKIRKTLSSFPIKTIKCLGYKLPD